MPPASTGHWRTLKPNQIGEGQFGEPIYGKTWVDRIEKTKNEDEKDLVESLKKMILDKFEGKKGEFYEWSQTIHDEVV